MSSVKGTMNGVSRNRSDHIRVLNDNFRTTFVGGQVFMTSGVAALPLDEKARVLIKVQTFESFDADNDPHGEHDFGVIEVGEETLFWKIDYYAKNMLFGSEDPADPEKTTRVLTIMLAEEY